MKKTTMRELFLFAATHCLADGSYMEFDYDFEDNEPAKLFHTCLAIADAVRHQHDEPYPVMEACIIYARTMGLDELEKDMRGRRMPYEEKQGIRHLWLLNLAYSLGDGQ